MAASSQTSTKPEKQSITPELALEIFQEAIVKCQQLGIKISVSPFFQDGQQITVIVLENVDYQDRSFRLIPD